MIEHPLKRYRERHCLTMRELAERIGVSQATVSRIEANLFNPSLKLIQRIFEQTDGEVRADDFLAKPDTDVA
jgi:transcriptional regulator with XRE-family HTH domain